MSTAFEDKGALREDILRRIHKGEAISFEELADAMFPKEHVYAISRRHASGLYSKQCGRDIADLLQQNLLLSHSVRMVNEFLQQNKDRLTEPVQPVQPAPPPRFRWFSWLRRA